MINNFCLVNNINKHNILFLLMVFIISSCEKKTNIVINKNDSVFVALDSNKTKTIDTTLIIKDTTPQAIIDLDSLNYYQPQIQSFLHHRNNFKTFSSQIFIDYEDNNRNSFNIGGVIKIIADSVIWVSLNYFGLEVARALLLKDGIYVKQSLNQSRQYFPLSYIKQFVLLDLTFKELEDILIQGYTLLPQQTAYKINKNDNLLNMQYKNNDSVFSTLKVIESTNQIQEFNVDIMQKNHKKFNAYLNQYITDSNYVFSLHRQINVNEGGKEMNISIIFKNIKWDSDIKIPNTNLADYKK